MDFWLRNWGSIISEVKASGFAGFDLYYTGIQQEVFANQAFRIRPNRLSLIHVSEAIIEPPLRATGEKLMISPSGWQAATMVKTVAKLPLAGIVLVPVSVSFL